jgi:SOS-response transcriptional repressor LexA
MKNEAPVLITDRIVSLMHQQRISEATLARQIGVPQGTISRILSGATRDPRISTVAGIAQVLGTTIDHLIHSQAPLAVPLLEWNAVNAFLKNGIDETSQVEWVVVSRPPAAGTFALKATPSMEPRYRTGSTIIVEPTSIYRDFQVAIVTYRGEEPSVRQLIKDGSRIALKKLGASASARKEALSDSVKILGVVTEARMAE